MNQSLWKRLPPSIRLVLLGGIGATCACLILIVALVGSKSTAKLQPTAIPPQRSASMALVALDVTDKPIVTAQPKAVTNTAEPTNRPTDANAPPARRLQRWSIIRLADPDVCDTRWYGCPNNGPSRHCGNNDRNGIDATDRDSNGSTNGSSHRSATHRRASCKTSACIRWWR